ncbi:hypothetical protein GCE9029_04140 [Grimontia celer]|uniref:Uncharacterized protein n=1 Tax=Grimontia celer TaxID=1796497 RepID=A0A128FB22_9GAMM|nr:hypothetical protein GCE9029_04140 [Grimontia celer]
MLPHVKILLTPLDRFFHQRGLLVKFSVGKIQHTVWLAQIQNATAAEQRRKVGDIPIDIHGFVVKRGEELTRVHALGMGNMIDDLPELLFQPDTRGMAREANRTGMHFVIGGILPGENGTHDFLPLRYYSY